jgi:hypothetical protein
MKIAKVVSSNSHIDYIGRVIDALDDGEQIPQPADYSFGEFIGIEADGETVVGVIYDSRLVNPEYGSFAPRSGPRAELARHNADFAREQGMLIGILLLGTLDTSGKAFHGVPRMIIPVGQAVEGLHAEKFAQFHTDGTDRVSVSYYPQLVANARQFAIPLLDTIISRLCDNCSTADGQRLQVLKQSVHWQGTFGAMKL